ncbi:MAG: hypothetical protein A2Z64_10515 [Betaproteobacteria bacterium RIFCSPLOWO2_02_67_12]|nr:MAG: hypothetical protein A2Z64_10515 [Betaproteobacteria bacterium RIFCSPLOWO2_02_67_12]
MTCIKQHPGRTRHPAGVIMVRKPLTVQRTAFLVLALMAVTLLSLRSVCDLWFTHLGGAATTLQATPLAPHAALLHDADPAAQCCDSASGSSPIAPLQAAVVGPQPGQGIVPAVLVAVVAASAILARQPHWLRAPPRSPQSFYLRSARILR